MGRRYYCDYCDKSFLYTPEAVKKHVNGLQHQSSRNQYYVQFEDKHALLKNESNKSPCSRYLDTGHCKFGLNCRFTHFTRQQLETLRWEVKEAELNRNSLDNTNKTFKSWLLERKRLGLPNSQLLESAFIDAMNNDENIDIANIFGWDRPEVLEYVPNLPPSLGKITFRNIKSLKLPEWGCN